MSSGRFARSQGHRRDDDSRQDGPILGWASAQADYPPPFPSACCWQPGINATHQFTQVWNDCLPPESVRVDTRSRPPMLLQMLAPKPPATPIAFLSSMDLQLDDTSAATADSNDASTTSTMMYNKGHEDELSALSMPNLSRGQCRVILPSKETYPKQGS
jgi:hypothetical protein